MRNTISVLAVLALGCTGCGALDRVNDALYATGCFDVEPSSAKANARDCGVTIVSSDRKGRGVVVGTDKVLTVSHVVGDATEVTVVTNDFGCTAKAKVTRRIRSEPEDLVELSVTREHGAFSFTGFDSDRIARLGAGDPAFTITATGLHGWARGLKPGDSGSPVIDGQGTVVGLLVGMATGGRGVLAPVTGLPSGHDELVLARLSAPR